MMDAEVWGLVWGAALVVVLLALQSLKQEE